MKIVIAQHECFYVPIDVVKKYFELKGEKIYFYDGDIKYSDIGTSEERPYKLTDNEIISWNVYIVNQYFGETAKHEEIFSDALFNENNLERDDLNFTKAVEELKPYNLKVIEIPDDVKWYIYESEQGFETIHEEHRIWY